MVYGIIDHDMYRILMPIDDDDARVDAQTEAVSDLLQVADDVEVTLFHVFDDEDRAEGTAPSQLASGREARERLADAGATVIEESRAGNPSKEIIRAARETGANQIVLGGRKRSPLGAVVFGSVSQDVIREATVPATVAGSAEEFERPSHRCTDCGEVYYADPDSEITTCRQCGGVHVERVTDEQVESARESAR